jgi:putative phosphoribosyl transferase
MNDDLLAHCDVTPAVVARVKKNQEADLVKSLAIFRSSGAALRLDGVTALIVDDGLATGATARVACEVARARGARRVVLAVPVAPKEFADYFDGADDMVVVDTPTPFYGVGAHYETFDHTSNDEVMSLLEASRRSARRGG